MTINRKLIYVFCFLLMTQSAIVFALELDDKNKNSNVILNVQVVDEQGYPVVGGQVVSSKLRKTFVTGADGFFNLKTAPRDILVIKAKGFEKQIVTVSNYARGSKIILKSELLYNGEDAEIYTPFGKTTERRTVGVYSKIEGVELESTPSMTIESALGGRLNGLFQLQNTLVPGWTNHDMYVRGGWGNYIIIIDGVERSLEYLEPEVIEHVELLKDATLKSLYGGGQSNGILLITTKKGKAYENSVRVNLEHGVNIPTRLPQFLDSYDYATYYNKALVNDNFTPMYNDESLKAYKDNSSPILYPNVDYYDMFLNKSFNISRINTQIRGGDEKVRYFAHVGYQGSGGLEKYTEYPNADDIFTVRTTVDLDISDFLSFNAGFNGAIQYKEWPNISTQNFFEPLANHHPNQYPILIPNETVGNSGDGYVFGGTVEKQNNPYGLLTNRGYAERRYTYIQSDFSFKIDLNRWVKGLAVNPSVSFDIYNVETASKGATFAVFEPNAAVSPVTGNDTILFNRWGENTMQTSQSRDGADVRRNYAFHVNSVYQREFGKHDLYGLLNFYQSRNELRNVNQNPRRQNLGLHISDMISGKYIVEFNINRVGVTSFSRENRYGYFPAFGAGWVMSEENFMENVNFIDYLKFRASYGVLGSTTLTPEGGFSTYLYQDIWRYYGNVPLGGDNFRVSLDKAGNPNIGFQKSYEFNVGFETLMFAKSTRLSMGYFNNINDGLIFDRGDMIPGIIGHGEALPYWNYKTYGLQGVEGEISFTQKFGDVNITLGANGTYGITKRIVEAEPSYPIESFNGMILQGRPLDAILGLKAIGVFADQGDIDNSPIQMFGTVRPGDIKYADINDDGLVDDRDRGDIGNSSPRLQYGLTLALEYKGFNLNILGIGYGSYNRLLNTQYYQIYGDRKYSRIVIDGLPNGNPHPLLSTKTVENNFVNSDYWIVNSSFFKLRNVELGYTLPQSTSGKIGINKIKLFARGYNLFTLSQIKDLDPENLNAGIGNFPLCSTYTIGVSLTF